MTKPADHALNVDICPLQGQCCHIHIHHCLKNSQTLYKKEIPICNEKQESEPDPEDVFVIESRVAGVDDGGSIQRTQTSPRL